MDNKMLPYEERLMAYLDGELPPADRERIDRMLAANPAAKQLVDELRVLSGSLQSLPKYQLEADFYKKVLRAAEREVLLGRDRAGAPAVAGRIAPAAMDPGIPAAASEPSIDLAALPLSTAPRDGVWTRLSRPTVWASLTAAAALVVMIFSPDLGLDPQSLRADRTAMNELAPQAPEAMARVEQPAADAQREADGELQLQFAAPAAPGDPAGDERRKNTAQDILLDSESPSTNLASPGPAPAGPKESERVLRVGPQNAARAVAPTGAVPADARARENGNAKSEAESTRGAAASEPGSPPAKPAAAAPPAPPAAQKAAPAANGLNRGPGEPAADRDGRAGEGQLKAASPSTDALPNAPRPNAAAPRGEERNKDIDRNAEKQVVEKRAADKTIPERAASATNKPDVHAGSDKQDGIKQQGQRFEQTIEKKRDAKPELQESDNARPDQGFGGGGAGGAVPPGVSPLRTRGDSKAEAEKAKTAAGQGGEGKGQGIAPAAGFSATPGIGGRAAGDKPAAGGKPGDKVDGDAAANGIAAGAEAKSGQLTDGKEEQKYRRQTEQADSQTKSKQSWALAKAAADETAAEVLVLTVRVPRQAWESGAFDEVLVTNSVPVCPEAAPPELALSSTDRSARFAGSRGKTEGNQADPKRPAAGPQAANPTATAAAATAPGAPPAEAAGALAGGAGGGGRDVAGQQVANQQVNRLLAGRALVEREQATAKSYEFKAPTVAAAASCDAIYVEATAEQLLNILTALEKQPESFTAVAAANVADVKFATVETDKRRELDALARTAPGKQQPAQSGQAQPGQGGAEVAKQLADQQQAQQQQAQQYVQRLSNAANARRIRVTRDGELLPNAEGEVADRLNEKGEAKPAEEVAQRKALLGELRQQLQTEAGLVKDKKAADEKVAKQDDRPGDKTNLAGVDAEKNQAREAQLQEHLKKLQAQTDGARRRVIFVFEVVEPGQQ